MTGKIVSWLNRGRDRPTQPKEKVPSNPNGSGLALPELDVPGCNDAAENQAQADLAAGSQAVAAQPGG